jgi:Aminoglycoside-2''-adenylyltransferase
MDDAVSAVPEPVAYVRDLLLGFGPAWALCGGWAVDAWLGRPTRDHFDVDIAVFHPDQAALFQHFPGWAMVGHDPNVPDDTTEPWNGRHLDMPAHIHMPEAGSPLEVPGGARHSAYEFEFLLNDVADGRWILNRELGISVPLESAIRTSAWGLPTVAPEVILFFKGRGNHTQAELRTRGPFRTKDEVDFRTLGARLPAEKRAWLRDSLNAVLPDHPMPAALTVPGPSAV